MLSVERPNGRTSGRISQQEPAEILDIGIAKLYLSREFHGPGPSQPLGSPRSMSSGEMDTKSSS